MSDLYVICEGQTEQTFVRDLLVPHLARHGVNGYAVLLGRVGHKGGNVQFHRLQTDVEKFLKQRPTTYVTTMFDYYGLPPDWPGKMRAPQHQTPHKIATHCEQAMADQLDSAFPQLRVRERFIPYLMMHEFEALLFSDPHALATKLAVSQANVDAILAGHGEPEAINDSPDSAPSKQIAKLTTNRYKKVVTGIALAKQIGLNTMRDRCPHFGQWLTQVEQL